MPTPPIFSLFLFFFNDPATTEIYTLSLHDALPISGPPARTCPAPPPRPARRRSDLRSEEHTSELQSRVDIVCRLLLEKKKKQKKFKTPWKLLDDKNKKQIAERRKNGRFFMTPIVGVIASFRLTKLSHISFFF